MTAEQIVKQINSLAPQPTTINHQLSILNTKLSTLNPQPSTPNSNHSPLIVLTGGEPALQADEALVATLHATGMSVCIETNGTHALPDSIDWITCSPKQGTRLALNRADELKVVLTEGTDPEQWLQHIQADHLFLQPCSCQNTEQVIDYILRHPHWRLSLQTHKYLHIR